MDTSKIRSPARSGFPGSTGNFQAHRIQSGILHRHTRYTGILCFHPRTSSVHIGTHYHGGHIHRDETYRDQVDEVPGTTWYLWSILDNRFRLQYRPDVD